MNSVKNLKESIYIIEGLTLMFQDSDKSLKTANKILNDIYIVAHLHSNCKNLHTGWRNRRAELKKTLEKMGVI